MIIGSLCASLQFKNIQVSVANAKVSARQQSVYIGPL